MSLKTHNFLLFWHNRPWIGSINQLLRDLTSKKRFMKEIWAVKKPGMIFQARTVICLGEIYQITPKTFANKKDPRLNSNRVPST